MIEAGIYIRYLFLTTQGIEAVVAQLDATRHPAAMMQSYNLRTARPLTQKLIYTNVMRQSQVIRVS